ncbi:hypothetical protein MSTE_03646 [Mycobacteroides stephanolepidis]|uniref:Uncharacterized protein n=1 Tax=[Mycobacterium] stephanolepidis TaxID=1520670 RepID=A0A1Z4F133_9MYCO|nr:hypothetical protein MSTE_03646 [[Mycobacterium] stephanolepidis]
MSERRLTAGLFPADPAAPERGPVRARVAPHPRRIHRVGGRHGALAGSPPSGHHVRGERGRALRRAVYAHQEGTQGYRSTNLQLFGECSKPMGESEGGVPLTCGVKLYGEKGESVLTCPRCRTPYGVDELQEDMRSRARDQPMTGADVLRMMKLAGEAPAWATAWSRRGPTYTPTGSATRPRHQAARSSTPTTTCWPNLTRDPPTGGGSTAGLLSFRFALGLTRGFAGASTARGSCRLTLDC